MENTLKESLQQKLKSNFDIFLNIKINGVSFEIMPIQKDIPVIDSVAYIPDKDSLEIRFVTKSNLNNRSRQNDYLTYLLDDDENIIGFEIDNLKRLLKNLTADKLKSRLHKNIRERLKKEATLKEAIRNNIEKRNLQSLKDFLLSEAEEFEIK